MRENGFYWVKHRNEWIVGEYANGLWFIIGDRYEVEEEDFDEIIEEKLVPPV